MLAADEATLGNHLLKALPLSPSNVSEPYEGGEGKKHAHRHEDQRYCEIGSNVFGDISKNKKSGCENQRRKARRH